MASTKGTQMHFCSWYTAEEKYTYEWILAKCEGEFKTSRQHYPDVLIVPSNGLIVQASGLVTKTVQRCQSYRAHRSSTSTSTSAGAVRAVRLAVAG